MNLVMDLHNFDTGDWIARDLPIAAVPDVGHTLEIEDARPDEPVPDRESTAELAKVEGHEFVVVAVHHRIAVGHQHQVTVLARRVERVVKRC